MQLALAAMLFSTGGLAIKAITLSSWQIASFRSAIAALVLALVLPEARCNWRPALVGPAFAYAAMLILFVSATKLTTAANAIFLQSSAPLYLVILGPLVLKEPVRRADWMTLVVLGFGMTLFFLGEPVAQASAPQPLLGNVLAAISGLAWALVLLSLRVWGRRDPEGNLGMQVVVAGNLLAALLCLPMALPVAGSVAVDWVLLNYLGTVQIGLAYVLMTRGIRRVTALEASMIILLEPVFNPIWTWAVLGEQPGWLAILGGCFILGGTLFRFPLRPRRLAAENR